MIKADKIHKQKVIEILSDCFANNKSVNWIVKQDSKKEERIRDLMDYSFETCINFGQVYLNDDLTGAIICSLSDDKLPFLQEAYLTAQFVWKVTGIDGVGKALKREEYINQYHPQDHEFLYIWFIGLKSGEQGKGIGSAMLQEIINKSSELNVPIYLETSVEKNVTFYQKHGFEVFHVPPEEMFGFKLYFMRREPAAV